MDLNILNYFQNFKLGAEKDVGFQLELEVVQASTEECQRSLIGKLYGEKVANLTGLKNTLVVMWSSANSFKTRELGMNLYQFVFATQEDKQKVLNGKAWTFDSQFLVLKPWCENTDYTKASFNRLPIWI